MQGLNWRWLGMQRLDLSRLWLSYGHRLVGLGQFLRWLLRRDHGCPDWIHKRPLGSQVMYGRSLYRPQLLNLVLV